MKGETTMATKGMNAYECVKVLYGTDAEKIKEVMKSYPLFSRMVIMMNSKELLEILKAIPKVTARVIENGLSTDKAEPDDVDDVDVDDTDDFDDVEEVEEKPKKRGRRKKVEEPEPEEEEDDDDEVVGGYDNMTAKRLYEEICKRGISTRLKKRDKNTMIKCLKDHDEELKKAEKEDTEESDDGSKYRGKTAKELYTMCKKRNIKVEPKKNAAFYANELIKADKAEAEAEDDDWGDDGDGEDWDF